ncbi:Leucine efflux protein [Methylobacterium crusticola]|uniref:Leucine efflux protein n=1 Tax=Methylobacterium crusticola TaxID=1697972 RepID=A0ABQ4QZC4_9HYPH|nr:LysE family translocator [Methylobacterium crusticola]GJD50396.1 Leucine efflux protein [Methylobacterium crusticola]
MTTSLLLAAALAGFVYGITPGPGVLAVLGIGADQGRRAGAAFLVGHLVGDVLWTTLALVAIVGVTAVGSLVFDLLGLVSGLYLLWLGWRAVRAGRSAGGEAACARVRRPLLHGLTFGLTNPKAYPVAVATLTALLSAKAGLLTWAMLPALVGACCAGGFAAYLIIVGLVGAAAVRRTYRRHEILITRASGLMFIGFAAHAILHAAPGLMAPRRA